jgi:uncharacterized protein (TIGR00730 family)
MMQELNEVCVYCGSRKGTNEKITAAASRLGTMLAARGNGLVYGGASVGLMGVVADATLAGGGRVTGVITESLADHEIAHVGLNRLDVVPTMHERKARMSDLADGFIMLPGGFGTYDEFMEAVTWVQLGIHDKPCGILNIDGFFDRLLQFLARAVDSSFIRPKQANTVIVSDDPAALLDALAAAPSATAEPWLNRSDR